MTEDERRAVCCRVFRLRKYATIQRVMCIHSIKQKTT
jgi:hypothetical protein